MDSRFDVDSLVSGDNRIKELAAAALAAVEKPKDPSRIPEDVGVDSAD